MEILRKARNILSLAFLALAPAYAACSGGDPCASDMDCKRSESCVENTCESLEDISAEHENPCGNSEVYGQNLWEISSCQVGFYFREDCGIILTNNQGVSNDDSRNTYFGLHLSVQDFNKREDRIIDYLLDPEARFPPEMKEGRGAEVNAMLDRYHGYILFYVERRERDRDGVIDYMDDNAFIPVQQAFPGRRECIESQYYVRPASS